MNSVILCSMKYILKVNFLTLHENSRVSYKISTLFFSHSRLSTFPPEISFSFSTLKNFLEKSHSWSWLSVNLLSQKSGYILFWQQACTDMHIRHVITFNIYTCSERWHLRVQVSCTIKVGRYLSTLVTSSEKLLQRTHIPECLKVPF